jgi:RNA polymerase sigma factor (sigma-70 family)
LRDDRFERLYEEHAQSVFGFLAYRVSDRALAEDLLADTFERVLVARRRFDPRRGSERAWIYSIALNLVRDHVRRRDAEKRALERSDPGEEAGSPDRLEAIDTRSVLFASLAKLTVEERDAISLRFGGDLTVPEIAKLTGEPLTTVEGRVYRALRKLRADLDPGDLAP